MMPYLSIWAHSFLNLVNLIPVMNTKFSDFVQVKGTRILRFFFLFLSTFALNWADQTTKKFLIRPVLFFSDCSVKLWHSNMVLADRLWKYYAVSDILIKGYLVSKKSEIKYDKDYLCHLRLLPKAYSYFYYSNIYI